MTRRTVGSVLSFACSLVLLGSPLQAAESNVNPDQALPDTIEFNRDIRPILSDSCFSCHGPDRNKREAELRLDTRDGLLAARGDAAAVVAPGNPDASELWKRITTDNSDERMPPAESGKELTARDRDLIRRWVEQGATWEGHWSFNPIKRPLPPTVEAADFIKTPIDPFVLAVLDQHHLRPAAEADRRTLLRRLSMDLIGLPPSPTEVAAFRADTSPNAYEAQVDRLLASPHFGERLALWWLDLVRYADSVGYHGDQSISVFPFREYVINSFNANKRFDQFTVEQLAGDLLPNPTVEQRIASGYNRLGMMSAEGGVQPKEYLAKYIAERVRNASGVWLGATLGCAECHDHKFDPFLTRDFYRFEAFFADIQERGLYSGANVDGNWGPSIQVPSAAEAQQIADLDRQIAETKTTLETATPELATAQTAWETTQVRWQPLAPLSFSAANGAKLALLEDGSLLASGPNSATEVYTIVVENPPAETTAFRLEVFPHDSLPHQGPGRAENGNFVLNEFRVTARAPGSTTQESVPLQNATATFEQAQAAETNPTKLWSVAAAIDGDTGSPNLGWAILEKVGQSNSAVFETVQNLPGGDGAVLAFTLVQANGNPAHNLGRFRITATTAPRPVRAEPSGPPENIAAILAIDAPARTAEQQAALAVYYRSIAPVLEPTRQHLAKLEQDRTDLNKKIPTTLVTGVVEPRMIRVLRRGNWMDDSGEAVTPGVPDFLPQPPAKDGPFNRLDLARWMVSPENPLPARTLANRLWKLFLGAGLSRRVDDLGAQGEWPSHPELLDYLAGQLIDSGWDVKRLIKEIVMSGVYRQSSAVTPELREADPDNRWLARQARFRFDAELVRDNALAISGLLVERLGGPSAQPYQPPGYWAYLNFPAREWQNDAGENLYRRGLYTHWQRQYLHPSLLAFDAPSREECAADRPRSNTPLQALVLLNDPTYVEAARALGELILREGGPSAADRIEWVFQRALCRSPQSNESEVLLKLVDRHLAAYRDDLAAADELLAVGARPAPTDLDHAELAAWTSVARTILNLHETITRN